MFTIFFTSLFLFIWALITFMLFLCWVVYACVFGIIDLILLSPFILLALLVGAIILIVVLIKKKKKKKASKAEYIYVD